MPEQITVLVVDDDDDLRYSLERVLSSRGYDVQAASSGEAGITAAKSVQPSVILLDNRMAGISGIETLQNLRHTNPDAMIVLMTAFGTTQTAIEAMKFGAFDYIIKPFDSAKILSLVEKAAAANADLRRNQAPAEHVLNSEDYREGIVGSSEAMQEVFKVIGQVAASDVTVMITGESGTGKELVARCIYQHSHRSKGPFVAVNCAAIPDNLIESELFGHEKGAFTGATAQRKGRFEQCDGGTIFLDEIGDMTLPTQTKILRALQEGEIQRVGGSETVKVDVRMIAATNKDLEDMVREKTFREDLYYRLNVVRVRLPALRERLEDIPALADFMLQRLAKQARIRARHFSADVIAALCRHDWPGNVRELENVIYRSAVISQGETILPRDLPVELQLPPVGATRATGAVRAHNVHNVHNVPNVPNVHKAADAPNEAGAAGAAEAFGIARESQDTGKAPEIAGEGAQMIASNGAAKSLPGLLDQLYTRLRKEQNEEILQRIEREMLTRALSETGGNQLKSAAILGITRATLRKRIEQYGLK